LARVFPAGSTQEEIEPRRLEQMPGGERGARALQSVLEGLAADLIDGRGVAFTVRRHKNLSAEYRRSALSVLRRTLPRVRTLLDRAGCNTFWYMRTFVRTGTDRWRATRP
jgi:hypothetical protein